MRDGTYISITPLASYQNEAILTPTSARQLAGEALHADLDIRYPAWPASVLGVEPLLDGSDWTSKPVPIVDGFSSWGEWSAGRSQQRAGEPENLTDGEFKAEIVRMYR